MRGLSLNHVSIHADNLEESARFYEDLLGLERLPTPEFGYPVQWLRVGDGQIRLFQRPATAPRDHHLAIEVDDLQALWVRARALDLFDPGRGSTVRRFPDGAAQMYVRDPAGNLVELNSPDADRLDPAVVGELVPIPGPPGATLYHTH